MRRRSRLDPITPTRQNHALEHATISLLLQRLGLGTKVAGRAAVGSFYIYGNLPTELVREASQEALRRLKSGERHLAISPFCGTNIAVAGSLAGVASLLALGSKHRLVDLPRALLASIAAVLLGQPLGRMFQKHFTTHPEVKNLHISRITRSGKGFATAHKVETYLASTEA